MRTSLTTAIIAVTVAGLIPFQALAQSPIDVIRHFVAMDVAGERLTPQGWQHANAMFVNASEPPQKKDIIVISKDYAVSESNIPTNAGYYFGYEEIGRVDSSGRFHPTTNRIETAKFNKYDLEKAGSAWKIKGAQPAVMHLTPKAAIRFLTEMRDKSDDPNIKRNASESISKLKPYE